MVVDSSPVAVTVILGNFMNKSLFYEGISHNEQLLWIHTHTHTHTLYIFILYMLYLLHINSFT